MSDTVTTNPQSPFDMSGRTVWVTGSGSGIGTAVARLFAQHGANVVVHGLNQQETCAALQAEFEAMGRKSCAVDGDLTQSAAVADMVKKISADMGTLDILVNCAGGSPKKSKIAEMAEDSWDLIIEKNLKSVFLTTQAALPLLRDSSDACIVNVSSCVTRSGGVPGGAAYATAKGGVDVLTRALAKELAPEKIRVNAVSPGLVDSPFHNADAKEIYAHLVERIPLRRIADPVDLAGPILFLASKAAAYVTGEIIEVSGGTRLVS
ncbi:SDR family oxidoreductase [Marivita sp. S6314]|uniref:SDR family NAD(P)-dependent oxidoreductase n=1 Tax=Marivita sp. S6314 TaxID=2926406 RepID=UPI001FF2EF70|nr:SDR family NAD(P)-dependent oxidoreductase [Marivita sp. S6314]MCK0150868.1 SDR family oxidoreductase [Marivita sp. S6314]